MLSRSLDGSRPSRVVRLRYDAGGLEGSAFLGQTWSRLAVCALGIFLVAASSGLPGAEGFAIDNPYRNVKHNPFSNAVVSTCATLTLEGNTTFPQRDASLRTLDSNPDSGARLRDSHRCHPDSRTLGSRVRSRAMEPLSKTERDESFMNHPFARIPGPPHAHGLLGRVAVRRTLLSVLNPSESGTAPEDARSRAQVVAEDLTMTAPHPSSRITAAYLSGSPWPTWRGSSGRAGISPFQPSEDIFFQSGPDWSFKPTTISADWVYSSPVVDNNGTIIFGNSRGLIFAIDNNGLEKWSPKDLGGPITSTPTLGSNKLIYIVANRVRLSSLVSFFSSLPSSDSRLKVPHHSTTFLSPPEGYLLVASVRTVA